MSITETKDGITLKVFVKPNSSEFKIQLDGEEIAVYSTQEPVKGKVNKEIIKETSKLFGTNVEIVSGLTSKQKLLLLKGTNKATVEEKLNATKSGRPKS
ncbi:MAG: DUF167 family protein [Candidatus Bathyarchaeota archaeon]|nr:DUF167 family protein [Candidatus Bathyarchaeota archaeon]